MKPGVSQRNSSGSSNASHSCHEARRLVGPVGVDRPAQVGRLVGHHPERAAVDAGERGDDARPEAAAQLEHGVLVEQPVEHLAHVVDLPPPLGDDLPQQRLVGHAHVIRRGGLAEVGEIALGRRDRGPIVGDAQVDDAVCVLHVDRADLGRLVDAQPAALDHRRAAHADARVLGRDHHVAAAEQRGVAREAVPGGDPHERDQPAEAREQVEGAAVEARDDRRVDIARSPAAALGEQHHRQPAGARRARTAGPSSGGRASPACRRAPCSRRTSPRSAARRSRRLPPTRPSAGVRSISSSRERRRSWAANTSGPYSTNVPSSTSSARFSRAVRRPRSRRLATASGRAASEPELVALAHRSQVRALAAVPSSAVRTRRVAPSRDHRSWPREPVGCSCRLRDAPRFARASRWAQELACSRCQPRRASCRQPSGARP